MNRPATNQPLAEGTHAPQVGQALRLERLEVRVFAHACIDDHGGVLGCQKLDSVVPNARRRAYIRW